MTAGVYQILNKVNGFRYIAGSVNAEQVLASTVQILSTNIRPNVASSWLNSDRKMSVDWNLYGKDNFTLGVIEKTSTIKSIINKRTMYWCRILQPVYNEYEYLPLVSGIYRIVNAVTNYAYIGQSQDVYRRFVQHRIHLTQGIHANSKLQQSWNKYGADNFKFEILEECLPENTVLLTLERFWIKRTAKVFNVIV